jgi:hypothetical protein
VADSMVVTFKVAWVMCEYVSIHMFYPVLDFHYPVLHYCNGACAQSTQQSVAFFFSEVMLLQLI